MLHDAFMISNPYRVANTILVFQQNKESGNHILHETLRAESDGKAKDSGTGQQRSGIDIEFSE